VSATPPVARRCAAGRGDGPTWQRACTCPRACSRPWSRPACPVSMRRPARHRPEGQGIARTCLEFTEANSRRPDLFSNVLDASLRLKIRLSLTTVVPHQVVCNAPHVSILSAHMSTISPHVAMLPPSVAMVPPHVALLSPKRAVTAEPGWQQRATRKSRMVDAGSLLHDAESYRRNIE